MRAKYPVSWRENITELRALQESLTRLLGYDENPFDSVIDVSGTYDKNITQIDASGASMLDRRLGSDPMYGKIYSVHLKRNVCRRSYE